MPDYEPEPDAVEEMARSDHAAMRPRERWEDAPGMVRTLYTRLAERHLRHAHAVALRAARDCYEAGHNDANEGQEWRLTAYAREAAERAGRGE